MASKYVLVVGGVFSGTGKGISAASIALLMKMRGLKVQVTKFDPYLNLNAGTMSPGQHGECFLCNDGTETDLDLGHYERITGIEVSANNIYTGGSLYKEVLADEEKGKYLGQTVQMIPHLTNKIIERLEALGEGNDLVFAEIGGTVGDMESACFLEAARQFKQKNHNDVIVCLVSPILWVPTIGEYKTKPLQNSVKTLQSFGLQPDILLCRTPSEPELPIGILDKIANLTNVPRTAVFEAPDVKSIYQVPIEFWERNVDDLICDRFHFQRNGVKIKEYKNLVEKYVNADELPSVEIGIVGKYVNAEEAYVSLKEALYHAGLANKVRVRRRWINAEDFENQTFLKAKRLLDGLHGVIIPGGFDSRGVEGKIKAIRYCREGQVPILGICLGLQCMVIETARNLCGLMDANSVEFDPVTPFPVIHHVPGQAEETKKSGTMRLGAFSCEIQRDSLAWEVYKKRTISERHRHRYEVNGEYGAQLDAKGLAVSGVNPQHKHIEIMEMSKEQHPYFIGTQAHPEFKSRLGAPAPLFFSLVEAAVKKMDQQKNEERCKLSSRAI
jgi:CTP synthase